MYDEHRLDYESHRSIIDGPPHHLIGGAGIGPGWSSTRKLYEALTGTPPGDFWGSPATDRFKRALAGGNRTVAFKDDSYGQARFSTPEEAAEAAETIREIAERGGPNATREEIAQWDNTIEKYAFFFDRYEEGEELVYTLY